MIKLTSNLKENYSPLYFLASLGAGGIAITFFMYLMFLVPHTGAPIATFDTLQSYIANASMLSTILIYAALVAIIIFTVIHIRLLFWNVTEYFKFKETEQYLKLKNSNAEVQLMAIPLTFGMTINVSFIIGALFVPGLWNIVEYLFPIAIAAFAVVGVYAIKIFSQYTTRVLFKGDFDTSKNNNLSQMLGVFAFSMVGVGFSASAAMSTVTLTSSIAIVFAILFTTLTVVLGLIKITTGFNSLLEHGADKETSVSLWIIIPIMTLVGIAVYRINMAMHHNFNVHTDDISSLIWFSIVVSIQVLFAVIGYNVMKSMGYFKSFINGDEKSPASYALVCPGVAGTVIAFFFLHKGLVLVGALPQFSIAYYLLLAPIVYLQFITIRTMFKLNKKLINA